MLRWVPVSIFIGVFIAGHFLLQIEKWSNGWFAVKNMILQQKQAIWFSLKCLFSSHFFKRIFSKTLKKTYFVKLQTFPMFLLASSILNFLLFKPLIYTCLSISRSHHCLFLQRVNKFHYGKLWVHCLWEAMVLLIKENKPVVN